MIKSRVGWSGKTRWRHGQTKSRPLFSQIQKQFRSKEIETFGNHFRVNWKLKYLLLELDGEARRCAGRELLRGREPPIRSIPWSCKLGSQVWRCRLNHKPSPGTKKVESYPEALRTFLVAPIQTPDNYGIPTCALASTLAVTDASRTIYAELPRRQSRQPHHCNLSLATIYRKSKP